MNDLAIYVDNVIASKGIKKTWLAGQLGISQQLLYRRMNKKNFSIIDADYILKPLGLKIVYTVREIC